MDRPLLWTIDRKLLRHPAHLVFPKKRFFKTVCPESALISGGRPLIVSNSRLVDQLRNLHRFLQLYKFLVAAPERDAEITAIARTLTRKTPRLVP